MNYYVKMSEFVGEDIKAVIFDHDDTLVGTIEAKWAQHRETARTWYNKELSDDDLRRYWGEPLKTLLGLLYETDAVDEAMERVLSIHHRFPKRLFVDTLPTLSLLHNNDRKIGVVTATSRFSFENDITTLGIPRELLDYTQTEEDTPFHKPDPRVFEPALSWLEENNIAPNEVTYVGDGFRDYHAARDVGFNFVGVETGLVTAREFYDAGVVSISSLAKLVHESI